MSKTLRKGAVFALAAIMTLAMSVASFADYTTPPEVGTKATEKATISVAKNYQNEDGALTADTFNFKITPVQAMNGANGNTIAVADMPLKDGETKSIEFSAAEVKGQTGVIKGTTFSEMTFTQPGYYLYKVNEVIPEVMKDGVTYDDSDYYICVYVVENVDADGDTTDGVYVKEITSWHCDADNTAMPDLSDIANVTDNGGTEAASNTDGVTFGKVNYTQFVNISTSQDIVVEKEVKGNLGDRDKAFGFTTVFTGLNPGSSYDWSKNGTAQTAFTADENGAYTLEYTLKADESIQVKCLPIGATYTTTEAASNHKASYAISGDGEEPIISQAADANSADNTALACATEMVDSVDGTITQHFVNERNLATITGVPGLDVMAYGFAALMVAAAAFFAMRRRSIEDME